MWLSPISLWEALILAERGRVVLEPDPAAWWRQSQKVLPVLEVPVTYEVAAASRNITIRHQDPADRFIAASAIVYGLRLVTADKHLLECPDIQVLANR